MPNEMNADIARLRTAASEMANPDVADRVLQLVNQIETEERNRVKSDNELAHSAVGQGFASALEGTGWPTNDAFIAQIVRSAQ